MAKKVRDIQYHGYVFHKGTNQYYYEFTVFCITDNERQQIGFTDNGKDEMIATYPQLTPFIKNK